MKKKQKTILLLCCILLGIEYCLKAPNKSLEIFESNRDGWFYRGFLFEFFVHNTRFPDSIEEFFLFTDTVSTNIRYNFKDPFSDEIKPLFYIPIINRDSISIGYVLLSRGPDSQINNHIDNLFQSDIKKLKLYNSDDSPFFKNKYIGDNKRLCKFKFFDIIR